MKRLSAFLKNPFNDKLLLFIVLLGNIAGAIYGYTWYAGQLADTPWFLWPWVPDSPWSATLFALVLLFYLGGVKNAYLNIIAYAWVIKYGLWAIVVLTQAWYIGGSATGEEIGLWVSHFGMALEGIVFARHLNASIKHIVFLAVWLLANDFMDYAAGLHPTLFYAEQFPLALVTAIILSVCITGIFLYVIKNYLNPFGYRTKGTA